jgi:hypothetical protein
MNTRMPQDHPRPFGSVLWDHLEEVRTLREERKTWPEIVRFLQAHYDLTITAAAVRNFFVRSRNPKRRIPAGFERTAVAGVAQTDQRSSAQRAAPRSKAGGIPVKTEPDYEQFSNDFLRKKTQQNDSTKHHLKIFSDTE